MNDDNAYAPTPDEPPRAAGHGEPWDADDEPVEVEVRRPLERVVPLRLPAHRFDALASEARDLGLSPAALARMWVMERLRELGTERPGPRRPLPAPERGGPSPARRPHPRDFDEGRPPRERFGEQPPRADKGRYGEAPRGFRPSRDVAEEGPPRRTRDFDDSGPPGRRAPRPYQGGSPPWRPTPPRGERPGSYDRRPPGRSGPPPGGRPGPRRPRRDEE